jgi:hypothetical protein
VHISLRLHGPRRPTSGASLIDNATAEQDDAANPYAAAAGMCIDAAPDLILASDITSGCGS